MVHLRKLGAQAQGGPAAGCIRARAYYRTSELLATHHRSIEGAHTCLQTCLALFLLHFCAVATAQQPLAVAQPLTHAIMRH